MAGDGTITREDIIKDNALTWGPEYAKQVKEAINANKEFLNGLREINTLSNSIRGGGGNNDYTRLRNEQRLTNERLINSTRQLEAAELSAQRIEQARLRTEREAITTADRRANSQRRGTQLTIEERIQNEINNRALRQQARETLGLVGPYERLVAERLKAKKVLLDLMAAENQNASAIRNATRAFEELDRRVRAADRAVGDFQRNVGNYPTLTGFANNIRDLVGAFGLIGGIQAFAAILSNAYQTIKQFEQSLADLSSITGATGKDLKFLKDNAIDLGQTVEGGAKAVVEAYKLIAGAKPELLDNVQALNQVTDAAITLSQAAGIELPNAATALTDAMNQFGADASQAQRFIDALANGAKFGSAEIPELTESLLKFGAVARSSNVSIEESAALVELLAENGLKGAEAGTALRNILLKISAPDALPKTAVAELNRLGISMKTLRDSSLPVQERLEVLAPLLKNNASIVKVFGLENATSAINVLSHTDRLKELTGQMNEVGTASEQAAVRMETLNGKTEILKSTYDSFILSVGSGSGVVSDFFKFFIEGATGALKSLIRLNTSWDQLFEKAKQEGSAQGAKSFQTMFNNLISPKISDQERKNIRERLKQINEEIDAGYNDPKLTDEKSALLKRLGVGSDRDIAATIRRSALLQRKNLIDEYYKNEKAIEEAEKGGFVKRNILGSTAQRDRLKAEKERLTKAIAEQNQIIVEAQKKVNSIDAPKKAGSSVSTLTGGTDEKAEKDRLKKLKALSDAEFALQKEKLERYIKINQEITDNELLGDNIRTISAQNVQETELQLIELTKQNKLDYDKFVKDSEKLNADQKALIQLQAYNDTIDSAKKLQKQLEKIRVFDEESYKKSLTKQLSDNQIAENEALQAENERFKALGNVEDLANKEREKKIEEHERNVFEIKKKYAIEALKLQIANLESELKASDALPEAERLTAEKRQEIAEKLSKAKLDLSAVEVENNKKKNQVDILSEREKAEQILNISRDLTSALNDLASALFETKIQNIQVEIDKNNEYYDKQIEQAEGNEKQIDLLEKERDKKNAVLEEKKKKEQRKQAVANKAAAIAQAVVSTALAVIQAYAQLGPIGGTIGAALVAAVGAIQIAAIAAQPIPKYKMGRRGGKAETAIVGDGGVPEVIERRNGKVELTPARDTLVELAAGDNVYKDIEDYKRNGRMSVMKSLDLEGKKVNEYFNITMESDRYGKEIVEELKETRKAISKLKLNVPKQKTVDLNHELWKQKNFRS